MTDKQLKNLSRRDLLEMLLSLSQENAQLRSQLEESQRQQEALRRQLEDRTVAIESSGTLAEAVLRLNGVFEAAQSACTEYEQIIAKRSAEQEAFCRRLEEETQARCDRMLALARKQAAAYLEQAGRKAKASP